MFFSNVLVTTLQLSEKKKKKKKKKKLSRGEIFLCQFMNNMKETPQNKVTLLNLNHLSYLKYKNKVYRALLYQLLFSADLSSTRALF